MGRRSAGRAFGTAVRFADRLADDERAGRVKGCAGELVQLTPAEVKATYYLRQPQPDAG